ncbi:hypothetical protein Pth03_44970 [Planotetraspora thailandica]|uniref:Uncharacterized protein n=1 Tax=Planotetraspora thailandica TaxID=487172 RepID=A0A8J3V3H3_9ACTN|nr:hypothetical protein Pth03_44970 [Planotetraspora thailandica]
MRLNDESLARKGPHMRRPRDATDQRRQPYPNSGYGAPTGIRRRCTTASRPLRVPRVTPAPREMRGEPRITGVWHTGVQDTPEVLVMPGSDALATCHGVSSPRWGVEPEWTVE